MRQICIYLFFAVSLTFFGNPASQLTPYRKNSKWGYVTADKKVAIPCAYDRAHPMVNGLAIVYKHDKGFGVIDAKGREIVPLAYDEVSILRGAMIRIVKNDLVGFLGASGKEIIAPQFQNLPGSSQGFFHGVVSLSRYSDGKWGAFNKSGKQIIPFIYDDMSDFSGGIGWGRSGSKHVFFDTTGNIIFTRPLAEVGPYSEGLAYVRTGRDKFFMNTRGEKVMDANYVSVSRFHNGVCKVGIPGRGRDVSYGVIGREGNLIIQADFDHLGDGFFNGLTSFQTDGKVGFLNERGQIAIPPVYEPAEVTDYNFNEGYCPVRLNGKWGLIDTSGKLVVQAKYDGLGNFKEGLASFAIGAFVGFIDARGTEIIPGEFVKDEYGMPEFHNGLAMVRVADAEGRISEGYIGKTGIRYFE
ncbi:MAG TPA: WG repeat-containing protein [Chryseosolibacter sp.]|nr:WG repeat-containing protein [Chryseosolibacter sp.]